MRERTITVDINKNYHKSLNYKQYDNNNVLNIVIKEDDNLVDITNYTARAFYQLPSKTIIQRNTTKNGKNTIKLKIDNVVLAESGRISLEVVINNVDTVVTTFTLFIDVEKSIDRNEAIEGYPEWDIIADGLSHLDDVENRMSIAENEIVDIESEVSTVKNRVSTVEGEVADIKNEVTDARNGETSLKTRLDRDIQNTEEKLNTAKNEINTTKNELNTTKNEVIEARNGETTLKVRLDKDIQQTEEKINIVKNEIIDARDGETSLKVRLDRDIEKAKQVYVNVEGSYISTDSSSGYAKDVEILGNTVQDASNLADIRSVGDKVEGQELYEIPVISRGKNLCISRVYQDVPDVAYVKVRIRKNQTYIISTSLGISGGRISLDAKPEPSQNEYKQLISDFGQNERVFTSNLSDGEYYLIFWKANLLVNPNDTVQLEEGTVATPYEPYVEDKLTILSPVQLEKVGDVADRIICKDGVLGVEKNVETKVLNGSESWNASSWTTSTTLTFEYRDVDIKKFIGEDIQVLSDKFVGLPRTSVSITTDTEYISTSGSLKIFINILKSKLPTEDVAGLKSWLKTNPMLIKYQTAQTQFIPLPHDQQVKLRTFANKTNISFLSEVEGTIKAQVPKSLGATVNTHTEQINNLNKELDRVKKLEESTVSTVTTESDFTIVEATSNGYFEDVKLEGKTLVNICPKPNASAGNGNYLNNVIISDNVVEITTEEGYFTGVSFIQNSPHMKPNTTYTIVANILENTMTKGSIAIIEANPDTSFTGIGIPLGYKGLFVQKTTTRSTYTLPRIQSMTTTTCKTGEKIKFSLMVLEGDHTQNPPSYFEGLKSVGQSATTSGDGVDEVSVESVKGDGNLCEGNELNISIKNGVSGTFSKEIAFRPTSDLVAYFIDCEGSQLNNKNVAFRLLDKNKNILGTPNFITTDLPNYNFKFSDRGIKYSDVYYLKVFWNNSVGKDLVIKNITFIEGAITPSKHIPHQSDKKRLLYYNEETQAWEKPILREWDSIEKHSDGKYYYHQRSGEVVLNGNEDWRLYSDPNSIEHIPFEYVVSDKYNNPNTKSLNLVNDKFNVKDADTLYAQDVEGIVDRLNLIRIKIQRSKLSTQDVTGFKQWLQANNVTVVYQLAEEKVYECTNIDLITFANETNYIINCGAITPRTTLKVMSNISNTVRELQRKVSTLESYIQYVMIDALNNALNE